MHGFLKNYLLILNKITLYTIGVAQLIIHVETKPESEIKDPNDS